MDKARRVMRIAAQRKWLALAIAVSMGLLCALAIDRFPDRYQATARIYVDTQTVLKPLMAGLTFQPDIDEQVHMLARTLISRPNVERLIATPALELGNESGPLREELISRLMEQIKVAPTVSGNLYEISYRGPSPQRAQRLVEATLNLFVDSGSVAKKKDSQDASHFIDDQIRDYETKLVEAENRRKDFKLRTFSVSGIAAQDYFTRMSALSDEVGKLQMELAATERTRDTYRRELASEDPQLPVDADSELARRTKSLDDLLLRFTDEHPDVVSTRRIVKRLQDEAREQKAAQQRDWIAAGKTGEAAIAPTSPVYQQLRISLADAEARLASLHSQLTVQQARLDEIRSVAGRAPQVEAELAQLNRDYEVIRKNYEVMVARRESASLGMKLDASSQLAEFRVIDPPRVSRFPSFPGRWHLAIIATILSIAAGIAAALLAEAAWPTLDETRTLLRISGRPVLGTVPLRLSRDERRRRKASLAAYAAAFAGFLVIEGAWVGWLVLKMYPAGTAS